MLVINRNKYYLLTLFGLSFLSPTMSQAISSTSSIGSEQISNINMMVSTPICQINNGQGVAQQITMPSVSIYELRTNTGKTATAPLLVDCNSSDVQPNNILVTVKPAGSSTIVNNGQDGKLATDKAGVGLLLTWKVNSQAVDLSNHTITFPSSIATEKLWDLSINAKPISTDNKILSSGNYTGTIIVNLQYD